MHLGQIRVLYAIQYVLSDYLSHYFLLRWTMKSGECRVELSGSLLLIVQLRRHGKSSVTPTAFICYQHRWTIKTCWQSEAIFFCVCVWVHFSISLYLNLIVCVWKPVDSLQWLFSPGGAGARLCFDVARWRPVPAGSDGNNLPVRRTSSGLPRSVWIHGRTQAQRSEQLSLSSQIWSEDNLWNHSVFRGGRKKSCSKFTCWQLSLELGMCLLGDLRPALQYLGFRAFCIISIIATCVCVCGVTEYISSGAAVWTLLALTDRELPLRLKRHRDANWVYRLPFSTQNSQEKTFPVCFILRKVWRCISKTAVASGLHTGMHVCLNACRWNTSVYL